MSTPESHLPPPSVPRIERAQTDDARALHLLGKRVMADPWSAESARAELDHPDSLCWVARVGDLAVGFLLARKIPGALEVMSMGVDPSRRRGGIARALLAEAVTAARGSTRAELILELRASNAPARALYQQAGFVVAGRRPRYYPGGEDALLMTLHLE